MDAAIARGIREGIGCGGRSRGHSVQTKTFTCGALYGGRSGIVGGRRGRIVLMMMLMGMVMMMIRQTIVMMMVVVMFIHVAAASGIVLVHRGRARQRIHLDQGRLLNRRGAGDTRSASGLYSIATLRRIG